MDFFVWQSAYGLEWYLSHFPRIDSEQTLITGEASPSYILDFKVAQQLREAFPNIKLLVILRNPIDRAFSQYHNYKRWINFESRTLEQAIADEQEILKQIDNVTLAGKTFWETQEGYLVRGMYVYFLEQWMSIFPREQFLILKSEDLYADPQVIMNQVFRFLGLPEYSSDRYLKYASGSYAPISVELRQELQNFFQPHNQRLEEFLGYQLNWQ
ncbi:MAG: sulfotransferase domain-containing protein [Microcoleaceae cyanobacterium]